MEKRKWMAGKLGRSCGGKKNEGRKKLLAVIYRYHTIPYTNIRITISCQRMSAVINIFLFYYFILSVLWLIDITFLRVPPSFIVPNVSIPQLPFGSNITTPGGFGSSDGSFVALCFFLDLSCSSNKYIIIYTNIWLPMLN